MGFCLPHDIICTEIGGMDVILGALGGTWRLLLRGMSWSGTFAHCRLSLGSYGREGSLQCNIWTLEAQNTFADNKVKSRSADDAYVYNFLAVVLYIMLNIEGHVLLHMLYFKAAARAP